MVSEKGSLEEHTSLEDTTPTDDIQTVEGLVDKFGVNHKRLMFKIDIRVVPLLSILYLLAFLDRVNVSNALVLGMDEDLNLTGLRPNIMLAVFFVSYCILEVPSNYMIKLWRPSKWLGLCMFLFGLITTLQGLVQNYASILVTRFFLGCAEASAFPGCFYLLSMWYRRDEAQKRYSFFFSSTTLAGAFGGLLASALGKMDGVGGQAGWRWVFYIEGIVTCCVGVFMYFAIPDFPEDVKWLSPNEAQFIRAKLELDAGKSNRDVHMSFKDIMWVATDYRVWLAAFMYFGMIVPAYGYAYFSPTIVRTYGYSAIRTQLFSVPPWAAAFAAAMVMAFISDKARHRYLCAISLQVCAIVGFIMLLCIHDKRHVQYGALFLVASGLYSSMPILVCWTSTNFAGHHRRSIATAIQIGFGNTGGFISTFTFLSKDSPYYYLGYSIGLAFTVVSMICSTIYLYVCHRDNVRRERGDADLAYSKLSDTRKAIAGDLNPSHRYYY
ncbi:hypothetical protein CANCADRAFT_78029 [Tortispora caseinolytica NRRL Y-17796]|uniref:Major facilitator superfamily (MFS) profile domain-containing protein n=1 Tax=Tortispora caseinolytica NRRL Y-17796 TaxID=767744 RepID=A0A1E4TJC7_9ASCO|nr:hypothetical protein CANCADRAFT_78029 [Tortispora caseinolytica NRRL Y-17796]